MAEQDKQKPGLKPPQDHETTMQRNLLLAVALTGIVFFSSQFLMKQPDPRETVKPVKSATPQQAAKPAEAAAVTPTTPPATPGLQIAASNEQQYTIETNLYRIELSNRGGVVRSWLLKQYTDGTGKPLEMVNSAAAPKLYYPLAFVYEGQKPSVDLNQVLFVAKPAPDGLGIDFEYSNGRTQSSKRLRFRKDSYLSQIVTEVRENGTGIPHLLSWRGGFGDRTVEAAASLQRTFYFDLGENKLVEMEAKVAKDGPSTNSGLFSFAGIEDTYFAGVFLPPERRSVRLQTISDHAPIKQGAEEQQIIGAAVGGDARNDFAFFVGPKDLDLLKRVDPKLEQAVDFGWFSFLAKPLFQMLNWLNDRYVHNYGWSIVIATILINLLLVPLKISGLSSMRKMAVLKPDIDAINKKYAHLKFNDPKKQDQQAEVMALYKKNGINPLNMGGCMPLLVQIPFFIAFYKVLSVAIEMRGADWLWVSDLSQPETLAIRLLPIAMIVTQFILQKMTPTVGADPQMQNMLLFMPLMMGFFFYGQMSGLVLYWLTGNLVGIAQQAILNRFMPAPATPGPVVASSKKPNRK